MSEITYRLVRSARRTIGLYILPDGAVEVRCPRRMGTAQIEDFVKSKRAWIERKLQNIPEPAEKLTTAVLNKLTTDAKQIFTERIAYYAPLVGVDYGRVTVRHQKTRWGSCSAKGNLNFNCLLMLAPAEVLDYVVVHELCHRKEWNHSPRFWAEVERVLPDYAVRRKWLKQKGTRLISRLP